MSIYENLPKALFLQKCKCRVSIDFIFVKKVIIMEACWKRTLQLSIIFYEKSIAIVGDMFSHKRLSFLDTCNFIINLNKPDI